MQVCTKCLYPSSHPLGITFNDEGVCSGCLIHQEKYQIDWADRTQELTLLLKDYKSESNYDCIIPVTGAADSYFITHKIKVEFGMNPLLVTYNNHYNTAVGLRNLARLKNEFDCDLITMTVNPDRLRKISRATLAKVGSIYWHSIAGQTVFPVRIACKFKIPLIIWGAHQGLDQVGMFSHSDRVEMTRKYRKNHDLMGIEAEDLLGGFEKIDEGEIAQFRYPEDDEVASVGVRGIYLNNYMFWNSRQQHEQMISKYGYETSHQTRTFDSYNNVNCWNYSDLHDYLKFIKCGFGKVVDHASREIRLNQMSRVEGIKLVQDYLLKKPANQELYFSWLGVTREAFYYLLDQFRNPCYWTRTPELDWKYLDKARYFDQIDGVLNTPNTFREFIITEPGISTDDTDKYVIFGKGTV
jgi:N-acetyl sugar amidotransferase